MSDATDAPSRADVFDGARSRLAEVYSYLCTAAGDPGMPLTDDDRRALRILRRRASYLLEAVNAAAKVD